jgi:hypothetical protein
VLYVATAELRTFKAKRLAANECDGIGLVDMSRGLFAIHESFDCCVSENNVSDLVERRFKWQGGKRIYGDFTPIRKALNVAVHLIGLGGCGGFIRYTRQAELMPNAEAAGFAESSLLRSTHHYNLDLNARAALRLRQQPIERYQALSHLSRGNDCTSVVALRFQLAQQLPSLLQDALHLVENSVSKFLFPPLLRLHNRTRDVALVP